jgi:hypothetical protein
MVDGLWDSHRRVIASGMLIVDSAAVRILELLDDRKAPTAMKVIEGSVTKEERDELRAGLLRLQALIVAFVQKYELEPSKQNLRRIVASDVSQIWISLEDSRPTRIRGYGAMSASKAEALEADLQEMLRIANRLRAVLNS